jgi:acyl dehydratase
LTRLDTADASGAPVCTSWYGTVYRGVEVEGPDRLAADAPVPPKAPQPATVPVEIDFPVPGGLAHIYSECARIWNPIHTDAGVAERAGLPAIILHGTATLALAVSRIVAAEAGADPERVARVAGRFAAMVLMPSELKVRIIARARGVGGTGVFFEVLNDAGKPAIRDGFVGLRA